MITYLNQYYNFIIYIIYYNYITIIIINTDI